MPFATAPITAAIEEAKSCRDEGTAHGSSCTESGEVAPAAVGMEDHPQPPAPHSSGAEGQPSGPGDEVSEGNAATGKAGEGALPAGPAQDCSVPPAADSDPSGADGQAPRAQDEGSTDTAVTGKADDGALPAGPAQDSSVPAADTNPSSVDGQECRAQDEGSTDNAATSKRDEGVLPANGAQIDSAPAPADSDPSGAEGPASDARDEGNADDAVAGKEGVPTVEAPPPPSPAAPQADALGPDVERAGSQSGPGPATSSACSRGEEDVEVVGETQQADDDVIMEEMPQRGPRGLGLLSALRAKVQQALERGSYAEAAEKLQAQLATDDQHIQKAEEGEVAAATKVEEANKELQVASGEVASATQAEAEAYKAVSGAEQRLREAAARTAARRNELQQWKDAFVILEMRVAKRKADEAEAANKSRKIEELQQVLDESRRAAEEIRQREQQAREAMKELIREQKKLQLARLGRFTRQHRMKMLTRGSDSTGAAESAVLVADKGAPSTAASQADAPVYVKREVMQAFAPPRDVPTMTIVIDDDSQ